MANEQIWTSIHLCESPEGKYEHFSNILQQCFVIMSTSKGVYTVRHGDCDAKHATSWICVPALFCHRIEWQVNSRCCYQKENKERQKNVMNTSTR